MKNKLLKLLFTNLFVFAVLFATVGQNFDGGLSGWTLHKSAGTDVTDMFEHGNIGFAWFPYYKANPADLYVKTDMNGVYGPGTHTWAISPEFNLSASIQPKLGIEVFAQALQGWHGGYIEYTTDGTTWNLLGSTWYDNTLSASLGGHGCWANTSGWANKELPLDFLVGYSAVKFKIVFMADANPASLPGFGFDNFSISETYPGVGVPMAVELISPQSTPCALSASQSVTVKVWNGGSATLTAPWYIKYNVGATANAYEVVNTPLAAGAFYTHTFGSTYDFSAAGTYTVSVTTSLDNSTPFSLFTADVVTEALVEINTFPHIVDFSAPTPEFGYSAGAHVAANIVAEEVVTNGVDGSYWVGGAGFVTEQNAWADNTDYISKGYTCNVDATSLGSLDLIFDLYQQFSYSPDFCWFRVLVNGVPVADINGNVNHNPATYETPAYHTLRYDLQAYAGSNLNIEFQSSTRNAGDMVKIDNFILRPKLLRDLGISAILAPVSSCELGTESVVIEIKNYGTLPAAGYNVEYTFGASTVNLPGPTVLGGWTSTFTFPAADFSAGGTLSISIIWVMDGDLTNNAMSEMVANIANDLTTPYTQDFEGANNVVTFANWAIQDANSDGNEWFWLWDSPSATNAVYGYDYEDLDTIATANDYLFTSCFNLDANEDYQICFDYATYLAGASKGFEVYFSTSQDELGISSPAIISMTDINTFGAYQPATTVFQVPSSGIYYVAFKALGTLTKEAEYLFIDNIMLTEFTRPDLEITDFTLGGIDACAIVDPIPVTIEVTHQSGSTLCEGDIIELQYKVSYDDGVLAPYEWDVFEEYTITAAFAANDNFTYTFSQLIDMSSTGIYTVWAKVNYAFEGTPGNDMTTPLTRINYGTPQGLMISGLADGYCEWNAPITVTGSFDNPFGFANTQTLTVSDGSFTGSNGNWTFTFPGTSGPITFEYTVEFTDPSGCSSSVTKTISVTHPVVSAGLVNVYITYDDIVNQNVPLDAGFDSNYSYSWMPNGETGFLIFPTYFGQYTVEVTEDFCTVSESVWVYQDQQINLRMGWGMWSTLIDAASINPSNMINKVVDNGGIDTADVIIMKDEIGQVWWPQFGVNNIGMIVNGEGYQYKMAIADQLSVKGLPVIPELTPMALNNGYNMVGFLRQTASPVAAELASIYNKVDIFKDEDGKVYWPVFNIDQIGNLNPGKGYKVKVNEATSMAYSANSPLSKATPNATLENQFYTKVSISNNNLTLGIPLSAWSNMPSIGDEVGVFAANGQLVGSSVFNGNNMAVALFGDDELTDEKDGLHIGEVFTIKVWNQLNDVENTCEVVAWETGSDKFAIDGISVVKNIVVAEANTDGQTILYQNMPNPFSQTTQIRFYLPEASNVNITVYNVIGKVVKELVSADMVTGYHTVDFNASELASGTYFYKFVTNDYTETKYMSIEK